MAKPAVSYQFFCCFTPKTRETADFSCGESGLSGGFTGSYPGGQAVGAMATLEDALPMAAPWGMHALALYSGMGGNADEGGHPRWRLALP